MRYTVGFGLTSGWVPGVHFSGIPVPDPGNPEKTENLEVGKWHIILKLFLSWSIWYDWKSGFSNCEFGKSFFSKSGYTEGAFHKWHHLFHTKLARPTFTNTFYWLPSPMTWTGHNFDTDGHFCWLSPLEWRHPWTGPWSAQKHPKDASVVLFFVRNLLTPNPEKNVVCYFEKWVSAYLKCCLF